MATGSVLAAGHVIAAGPLGGALEGSRRLVLIGIAVLVAWRVTLRVVHARRRGARRDEADERLKASATASSTTASAITFPLSVPGMPHPSRTGDGLDGSAVLVVRNLTVAYGSKTAVANVSFEIRDGEIFGLLGPNGAGKTSTLSAIEGLVRPRAGTVLVDGLDVRESPAAARARLGVQLQATSFQAELTIVQLVRLFGGLYGMELTDAQITERLTAAGLVGHARKPFRQLSGGQQQRLSLLIALIHDPRLLLLDEPTTGLDPQSRRQLWRRIERIRDSGGSVLLTTHSMEEAQAVCDQVAIIDRGLLATGAPGDLIDQHR
ncbi:MAG TPA: ABC transporter ATP-binding protein, partial [Acidothermaceae bacterium]|nr:ABC transporter ATP-binding protein [Acidothermaceae bacterium]